MPIIASKANAGAFGYGWSKTSGAPATSWLINGDTGTSTFSSQFIKINWDTGTFSASSQTLNLGGAVNNTNASYPGNKGVDFSDTSSKVFSFATETFSNASITGYANAGSVGSGYHDSANYQWISGGGSYPGTTSRARIAQSTLTLSSQGSTFEHYGGSGFANSGGNGYDTCGYNYGPIATTYKFTLSTGASSAIGNAVTSRYVPSGTFDFNSRGYLGGGQDGSSTAFYYSIEQRLFSNDTASNTGASMTAPCQLAAYVQANGKGFYIAGGGQTYVGRSTRIDKFTFASSTVSTNVSSLTDAITYVRFFTNQGLY